jgi:ubiquinol-cytochrome c reductase cytochrome c1 subunit
MLKRFLAVLLLSAPAVAMAASGGPHLEKVAVDVSNTPSLQRGARNFINYCSGCHSAKYIRFSRLGTDLGLTEEQLRDNLMFAVDRPSDTIMVAMPAEDAKRWFGQTPPDLSLTARSRGPDWLYGFLTSFYEDNTRATGMNNLMLPGASMPHVLWQLQGIQKPVYRVENDAAGNEHEVFDHFELVTPGKLSGDEYKEFVTDTVNFLVYIAEPMQLQRVQLGIWVMFFLLVFFFFAYALKKEYWKDVH